MIKEELQSSTEAVTFLVDDENAHAHPILAIIFDYFFANVVILSCIATVFKIISYYSDVTGITKFNLLFNLELNVAIILISLVYSLTYQIFISKKVRFMSFGDKLSGKKMIDSEKNWNNQFTVNRVGIFIYSILNCVGISFIWFLSLEISTYSFLALLLKWVSTIIIYNILIQLINGAVKLLTIYTVISCVSLLRNFADSLSQGFSGRIGNDLTSILLSVLFSVFIIIYYPKHLKRNQNKAVLMANSDLETR